MVRGAGLPGVCAGFDRDSLFTSPPAGKSVLVTPRVDEEMTGYEIINLTQVALGAKPAKGAHTLFIQSIGATESGGWMILCFWRGRVWVSGCVLFKQ